MLRELLGLGLIPFDDARRRGRTVVQRVVLTKRMARVWVSEYISRKVDNIFFVPDIKDDQKP